MSDFKPTKSQIELAKHFASLDKSYRTQSPCLVSLFDTCAKKSINSHTISQVNLRLLAEDGHLIHYSLPDLFKALDPNRKFQEECKFTKVGLRKASSFLGFCSTHDTKLFNPIDTADLDLSVREVEILAFRTFMHECYKKVRAQINTNSFKLPDLIAETERQVVTESFVLGYTDLLMQSKTLYKNITDNKHDYKYLEILFSEPLPFCFICPTNLELKSGFGNKDPKAVELYQSCLFGLIPTKKGSKFILAFPKSQQKNIKTLMKRLTTDRSDLPEQILQLALESAENLYFTPSWIKSLSNEQLTTIETIFHNTLCGTYLLESKLIPDGLLNYDEHHLNPKQHYSHKKVD